MANPPETGRGSYFEVVLISEIDLAAFLAAFLAGAFFVVFLAGILV